MSRSARENFQDQFFPSDGRCCVAGRHCVAYDLSTKTSAPTDHCPLCTDCLVVAERDTWALPLDYGDLEQLLPPGARPTGTRVSRTDDAAIPLDLGVDALQREIAWTLTTWEPAVREAAGLRAERVVGVRPGWAVSAAVAVIAPRVDVLANLPPTSGFAAGLDAGPVVRSGVDAIAQLRSLHRAARSMLGLTRLVHRLPGECSRCGAESLTRENGSETVRCGRCEQAWTYDDYRRYVGMILITVETRSR